MRHIVISLPKATERRKLIDREFNRFQIPFQFFDAIDGAALSDKQESLVDYAALRRNAEPFPGQGAIACWMSHMAVLKEFGYGDEPLLGVFEDDVRFDNGATQVLDSLESSMKGFDIVKLNWIKQHKRMHQCASLTPSHSLGILNTHDFASCSYVIRRSAARHLVESFPRMILPMDHMISRYWENGLVVGIVNPPVAYHDSSIGSQIHAHHCPYPRYSFWWRSYVQIRNKIRMRRAAKAAAYVQSCRACGE